jgi:hypothetical protein
MIHTILSVIQWLFNRRSQIALPGQTKHDERVPDLGQAARRGVSFDHEIAPEKKRGLDLALGALGFDTFTSFVEQWPLLSIAELAARLGGTEWALHNRLVSEAETQSHHAVGYLVRSLLVRHLNLPGRHIAIRTWAFDFTFYFIAGMLPRRYRFACLRVAFGFPRMEIDDAWKPDCASDVVLVKLFSRYWDPPFVCSNAASGLEFGPIVRRVDTSQQN